MTPEEKQVLERAIRLKTEDGYEIHVIRKASDPIATRISCGGSTRDKITYCTYRGELSDAIQILRQALGALVKLQYEGREPQIAPDAGKEFA